MNTRFAIALVVASALLGACGGESHQDLRAWMAEQGKNSKGRLDPLPQIKPYEPLESYPLESLTMVGTLERGKGVFALVRTPERDVYQVRPGNYLGQNFGVVTAITDAEIKLKELVQDGSGDWAERSSTLNLQDKSAQGSKK